MSLTTSARLVRAIMAVACAAAMVIAGALPAAAASNKKAGKNARTYTVSQGPCTIDDMPKGASHQWTPTGESIVHRVQYGEGLQQIAYKYGFRGDDAFRKLWDANPQLKETWLDSAGITVRIPACGTQLAQRKLPKPPPPPEPEETEEPETTDSAETAESTDAGNSDSGNTDSGKSSGGDGGGSDESASSTPTSASAPSVPSGSVWDSLAQCESGGDWSINTGNGYYGGLQFSASSWAAVGGSGLPHEHSREEQIKRGKMLQSQQGWGAWPACSAKLGLG